MVEAAASRDPGVFRRVSAANQQLQNEKRLGLYVIELTRQVAGARLGEAPTLGLVEVLIDELWPDFQLLLTYDRTTLLGAFCQVLGVDGPKTVGMQAVVILEVALGLMLGRPREDLTMLRPAIAAYWRQNLDWLGEIGGLSH